MLIDNRIFDSYTVEFSSPLTDEDWEKLEDVDFDHTEHIWFHTKNGKEVHFYKNAIPIEWLEDQIRAIPRDKVYLMQPKDVIENLIIQWQWEQEKENDSK